MRIYRAFLGLLLSLSAAVLHAQSTETDIKARLINKPLFLRGFWADDILYFDSNGQIIGKQRAIPFTLSGFYFSSAHIKNGKLILEGYRTGLEFLKDKVKSETLLVGERGALHNRTVHLEVESNPSGDFGQALNAIFIEGLAGLVPSLPSYWKDYAEKHFGTSAAAQPSVSTSAPGQQDQKAPSGEGAKKIGGSILAPKLLQSAEPQFNSSARALLYGGNTLIRAWITTEGKITHLSIVRPIGLGLDEEALAAILRYTFQPATEDGKPVLVETDIEVNFQIRQ